MFENNVMQQGLPPVEKKPWASRLERLGNNPEKAGQAFRNPSGRKKRTILREKIYLRGKNIWIMAGLYIHVPFCAKRCLYCDFFSSTEKGYKEPYIEALIREMSLRKAYLGGEPLRTIYLGGGTPSQLSVTDLGRIFEAIFRTFKVAGQPEITLEANPDDMRPEYVKALRGLPVNRVSMGVQSFSDENLRFLRRRHTAAQALAAIGCLRRAGFERLSIDLIYGLPGQSVGTWQNDLRQAVALDLPHLSAYNLIYEEGTPLDRLRCEGRVQECDEMLSLQLFETTLDELAAAGYEQYEISNFARPGEYARHNTAYWQGIPYLGLGPSAHSYDGACRRSNPPDLKRYVESMRRGEPFYETESLDADTRYNDRVITSLRTMWGLDLDAVAADFGEERRRYCLRMARPHRTNGLLEISSGRLKLTRRGLFVSDGVMADLLFVGDE